MDDDYRERRRLQRMRNRKLRNLGRPVNVLPHEYEEGVRLLRYWHDERGMSWLAIGVAMGEAAGGEYEKTTVHKILTNKSMRRDTFNAIKGITYAAPPRPDTHRRSGAHRDATGTRRRLQALQYMGYSQPFLGDYMGMQQRTVGRIMSKVAYVFVITENEVAEAYGKLIQTTPEDMGIDKHTVTRVKLRAQRSGFAPPMCWDDDTINNPQAYPEWTGECGTPEGYYLHLRYDIQVQSYAHTAATPDGKQKKKVLCQPCRTAHAKAVIRSAVDEEGIREWLRKGDVAYRHIAKEFGVSSRTVQRVANAYAETGEWTPPRVGPRKGTGGRPRKAKGA